MARRYTGVMSDGKTYEVVDASDYDSELAAANALIKRLTGQLAACYQAAIDLATDEEDWLMAGKAVLHVERLRLTYDKLLTRITQLESVIDQTTAETNEE